MTVAFALPKPMRRRRIRKVEHIAPGWYGHWMRITSPDELDGELLGWLRESYHQMGMQELLTSRCPQGSWRGWQGIRLAIPRDELNAQRRPAVQAPRRHASGSSPKRLERRLRA